MEGPEERPGFAARTSEYLRRRTRQGLRIVRRALFPQPVPKVSATELAAAARLAALQTDEADEPAALATAAVQLERLAATVATLGGEITVCDVAALHPMRRADFSGMTIVDTEDLRGVCIGEGVMLSRGSSIECHGEGNVIVLAPNVRLSRVGITVRGSGNLIYIGEDSRLINVTIKAVGEGNTIAIGRDITFESGTLLCERTNRSLLLGDDCMVSNSVIVRTTDHHGIFVRSSGERLNPPADVVVGAHVWLGNGCRINKGTRIGSGTVVGQMAIASGILEPHCIYAGVPARKLRDDVVWSRTERLDSLPRRFR
jgi:acetyltransferase-like isoleucine patch superfamily enzyme